MTTEPQRLLHTPEPGFFFDATFRDSRAGHAAPRQVALGSEPVILIEPRVEGDSMRVLIDATDLTPAAAADMLEYVVEALRQMLA